MSYRVIIRLPEDYNFHGARVFLRSLKEAGLMPFGSDWDIEQVIE